MVVRPRIAVAASALLLSLAVWAAEPPQPFAVVGDTVITKADFQRQLGVAMRKKYYHAKPPEAEFQTFQREVGEDMVNRVLLLAEAKRRGVQPDREKINATIAGYDAQYKGSETWKANREKMLASVVPQLESESVLERFEKLIRSVAEPSDAVARAYYDQHKDLFVEPEQVKLSVILLRVDPTSKQAVWNSAQEEAKQLHKKLVAGADFAEVARLQSGDRSAANGGAMEYTHRGMLPEAIQAVIDSVPLNGISEPIQLLEGYVILRLDGRKPAQQRSFEQVRERAGDLWQRDEGEARWKALIADLRKATPVRIDEKQYAPMPAAGEKARAG